MLHLVDARLKKWAEIVLQDFPNGTPTVKLDAPTKSRSGVVISLFLLEVVNDKALARSTRPAPQPALRYLVTASGSPAFAHQALGILLWHAYNIKQIWFSEAVQQLPDSAYVGRSLFQAPFAPKLELEPVPSRIWSAFNAAPRPSFILQVPIPFEWLERPLPRVTGLAEMDVAPASSMVTLHGVLTQQTVHRESGQATLVPTPIPGAAIELLNPYRQVYTDRQGRFVLSGVNQNRQNRYHIDIRLRNGTLIPRVPLSGSGSPEQPLAIDIRYLHGKLVDENDVPIVGAQVELPLPARLEALYADRVRQLLNLDPQTAVNQIANFEAERHALLPDYLRPFRLVMTDQDGIFTIPAVLAEPHDRELTIRTQNRKGVLIQKTATFSGSRDPSNPAEIVVALA
ncbi:MAG: hypothetical protein AAF614_08010 [Chloroflexota bacterium]